VSWVRRPIGTGLGLLSAEARRDTCSHIIGSDHRRAVYSTAKMTCRASSSTRRQAVHQFKSVNEDICAGQLTEMRLMKMRAVGKQPARIAAVITCSRGRMMIGLLAL